MFNLRFLNKYLVDNILDMQIFWYNPVSLKKDRTSSILTSSNRSLKQFTLKNCFLKRANSLHSMRTCLMVQGVSHVKRSGWLSRNGKKYNYLNISNDQQGRLHTTRWTRLRKENLKRESKSLLIATQNNDIRTSNIKVLN